MGAAVLLALGLAACSKGTSQAGDTLKEQTADGPAQGMWRATLDTEGGELPFLIELSKLSDGWHAWYLNGAQRVAVTRVQVDDGHVTLGMPTLESRLEADLQRDGSLKGEITVGISTDSPAKMPFTAVPNTQYRFFQMLTPPEIDLDGRWAMDFTGPDGKVEHYIGEFHQEGSQVRGTILRPSGDMRYLAGAVRGRKFYLSTFDGSDARLFHAELADDGILHGDYWANGDYHATFTAHRDADAKLPDAFQMTQIDDASALQFRFPNLDGEPVSLSDSRFQDKVVIVTLGGSWCSNCHDEAAFLAPWYKKNHDRGVEVVELMFERVDSRDAALALDRQFRDDFDIGYPILLASASSTSIKAKLPMLDGVFAFPTTLFLNKQGQVVKIHTGFTGPGTGEHYTAFKREFNATVDKLLAE